MFYKDCFKEKGKTRFRECLFAFAFISRFLPFSLYLLYNSLNSFVFNLNSVTSNTSLKVHYLKILCIYFWYLDPCFLDVCCKDH